MAIGYPNGNISFSLSGEINFVKIGNAIGETFESYGQRAGRSFEFGNTKLKGILRAASQESHGLFNE